MRCKECAAENTPDARFCVRCGADMTAVAPGATGAAQATSYDSSPVYVSSGTSSPTYGQPGPGGLAFAPGQLVGFGPRVGAYLADWIILLIILAVLRILHLDALNLLVNLAYFVYFWSTTGQTLGQKALGLKVVRTDGQSLSVGTAMVRWIGMYVSFLALCIGVLWVIWEPNKQGWHDKLANTVVVRIAR